MSDVESFHSLASTLTSPIPNSLAAGSKQTGIFEQVLAGGWVVPEGGG